MSEGAPTAPSDPVVGRATHGPDLDPHTPTPLMLSIVTATHYGISSRATARVP